MAPIFYYSIAEVFLHKIYPWENKLSVGDHVGVTIVELSIIYSALFSEKLE